MGGPWDDRNGRKEKKGGRNRKVLSVFVGFFFILNGVDVFAFLNVSFCCLCVINLRSRNKNLGKTRRN